MRLSKRSVLVPALAALLLSATAVGQAQQKGKTDPPPVAGVASGVIGVTVEEVVIVAHGWSARRQLLGKQVVNDKNEKLGKLDDIIISPEKSVSHAIIGVGGFLGIGKHDVAIPINQLKMDRDRLVLAGASKEIVKAMPEFQYAK